MNFLKLLSQRSRKRTFLACALLTAFLPATLFSQERSSENTPRVQKVEPPNWWVGLTPDVMLLLYGKNLKPNHVSCNLREVSVSRTQASADGDYLFVWLKLAPELRSGTAICRIATNNGETTFELPFASRTQILGRNQGISLDDVIYLIMPDRFANGDPTNDEPAGLPGSHDRANTRAFHGGDLRGVEQHLDYLQNLGVSALWLTPVVKNGATRDYHGYGAVDLYAVDPHFGGIEEYQHLVQAAHKRHMKILFDVVPNHVGPTHPWVTHPPMPDWFHGNLENHLNASAPMKESFYGQAEKKQNTNDPFETLVDPHTPAQLRRNLTEGWFAGVLPDMNTENPIVVEYLTENAVWWAETSGLDGYRVDTFPYVSRTFWQQWHSELRKLYPRLSTIGEVFHPDPTITSFYQGGRTGWDGIDTQLTSVFDFPLYFTLRDVLLNGAPVGKISNVLRQDSLYPHPDFLVPFFANHDTARFMGAAGASAAKLELAFGLTLTFRGIPEIYYGDEIGMTGGNDPDNRRDFPGGWTQDAKNTFTREGRTPEQQEVFGYVQSLLQLRAQHPALRRGRLWTLFADDSTLIFLRENEEEKFIVAFHPRSVDRDVTLGLRDTPLRQATDAQTVFGKGSTDLSANNLKLHLPKETLSIFAVQ